MGGSSNAGKIAILFFALLFLLIIILIAFWWNKKSVKRCNRDLDCNGGLVCDRVESVCKERKVEYCDRPVGQNGYSSNGYSSNGYSSNGYSQNGHSQNGHSQNGYGKDTLHPLNCRDFNCTDAGCRYRRHDKSMCKVKNCEFGCNV